MRIRCNRGSRVFLERAFPAGIFAQARGRNTVTIVNGHPDPSPERFCAALCNAYENGAALAGRHVHRLNAGALAFAADRFLCEGDVEGAMKKLHEADQLIVVFPLWLDQPPAILHHLFARMAHDDGMRVQERPARTVITMEMPAFAHRALDQNARGGLAQRLSLPGVNRQDRIFIGGIGAISPAERAAWLVRLHDEGAHEFLS
jgi:putative NADPH-quinone reductase